MLTKQGGFGHNERYRRDASMTGAAPVAGAPASTLESLQHATVKADAASPPIDAAAQKGSRLIVGADIKLKGAEITDCDTLVVEGRVEAAMDARVIQIAEGGAYCGAVTVDIAEVQGRFEGEMTARVQLVVRAGGQVSGKIRYGKIVIDDGGEISGDIGTLGSPAPLAVVTPKSAKI